MSGWALTKMINKLKSANIEKVNRILFGFDVNTNKKERMGTLENLRKCPIADEIKIRLSPEKYFELLNRYRFVASPKGNGVDCHRTWEALYLGVVPITTSSIGIEYFKSLGLPIAIVKDYNHLEKIPIINGSQDMTSLHIDFWKNIIQK